jgi:hypothetical protein
MEINVAMDVVFNNSHYFAQYSRTYLSFDVLGYISSDFRRTYTTFGNSSVQVYEINLSNRPTSPSTAKISVATSPAAARN